jgi:hypothetical protein
MEGIERGTAKTLRIIALEFRSTGIGDNRNSGPSGGALVSTPISVGNGTWDVKVPLGDTPIYEDGSASFLVPAKTPLYLQVLDANGHAIQTMRSWATLQPGEVFSCVGCHEDKNTSAPLSELTEALRRGPQRLKPFYGKPRGFSFAKEIQPILDAKCVECHQNANVKPPFAKQEQNVTNNIETGNESPFSLKNEPILDSNAKRHWPLSYLNLTNSRSDRNGSFTAVQTPMINWINVQESPEMLPPYKAGAAKSGIMAMLDPNLAEGGQTHNDVQLTREELDKLASWLDMLVPAFGDYVEGGAWDDADKRKFAYYEAKKQDMHELDVLNNRLFVAWQKDGTLPPLPNDPNTYRNVVQKPGRVIDSLGWQVDFAKPIKTDQIVITLPADFPHDSCTIECSNGFTREITLQKTTDRQVFTFPVQNNVTWLKLTNFVPEQRDRTALNTIEMEVLGIDEK